MLLPSVQRMLVTQVWWCRLLYSVWRPTTQLQADERESQLLQAWTDEWCCAGVSRLNHRHHVRPHRTLYLFCVCSLFLRKIFAHCVKLFGSQAARMSGNICVCICIHLMFALKRISVRDLFPHRSRIKIHLSANGTQNWEFTSILVRCCLDDRRASGL